MPKVHLVKKARKDNPVVKKGESYYWWQFAYGRKQYSATYPKPQQLTQSQFMITVYDIQDSINLIGPNDNEEFNEATTEIVDQIQELIDETQSSFDNIPEQLQEAPVGQMMTERIEALEEWLSNIEDLDADDFDELDEAIEELQQISVDL